MTIALMRVVHQVVHQGQKNSYIHSVSQSVAHSLKSCTDNKKMLSKQHDERFTF